MKMEMEHTYDKMQQGQEFIDLALRHVGFNDTWMKWVVCWTMSSFNGTPRLGFAHLIMQGAPSFPLPFYTGFRDDLANYQTCPGRR